MPLPYELTESQKSMMESIARTPEFSYESLDENYPVQSVKPMINEYLDDPYGERALKYKTNEVAMKQKRYESMIADAKLNNENLRLSQVPDVMDRVALLNPQSDTFQQDYIKLAQDLPYGVGDKNIQDYIIKPLMDNHKQWANNKQYLDRYENKRPSFTDVEKAAKTIEMLGGQDSDAKAGKKYANGQPIPPLNNDQLRILSAAQDTVRRAGGINYTDQTLQQMGNQPIQATQNKQQFIEGKVYKQGEKRYKYTNGQFVELP